MGPGGGGAFGAGPGPELGQISQGLPLGSAFRKHFGLAIGPAFGQPLPQQLEANRAVLLAVGSDDLVHVLTLPGKGGLRQGSEPFTPVLDVGFDELVIGLGEVKDALDEADQVHNRRSDKARQQRNQQHDEPRTGIAQDELVDAK